MKKRVTDIKNSNQKAPQALLNKLNTDKDNKISFNKKVKVIKALKVQKNEEEEKIIKFEEAILDSRIIVHSPWKEYNDVTFKIIKPETEVYKTMGEGEIMKTIGLKLTKDKEYIIANLDN